jgi:hypothetical protein
VKRYYLRLTQSDFVKSGNTWTSPVYDLYENDSYTNFSTLKSAYGPDVLGNSTWVGLNYDYGSNTSETGKVSGGRYIDKSGRIDIKTYETTVNYVQGDTTDVDHSLSVYTATENTAATPYQWTEDIDISRNIGLYDTNQYAYFVLSFDTDHNISDMDIEILIRVDIARPNIGPLYKRARSILKKFPSWTEMYEDSIEPATPFASVPTSLGGGLISAMAGEWLEEMDNDIDDLRIQQFITTANTDLVSLVYEIQIPGITEVWSVAGDGTPLSNAYDLDDFYELDTSQDGYHWIPTRQVLYVRKNYTSIEINGSLNYDEGSATPTLFNLSVKSVWNWFDEFGIRVDLYRLEEESNESFRTRILDVYLNRPGAGREAFKLALRRELDLWQSFGSTPDSNYLGATPEIYDLNELANLVNGASPYMGFDDLPTQKMWSLIEWIAINYPTTWGKFKWNEALWDIGGTKAEGYSTLPYQFDATPAYDLNIGYSGIGDGDDLYVYRPDEYTGPEEFTLDFTARGHEKTLVSGYPTVSTSMSVRGKATYDEYNAAPEITERFCLRVTVGAKIYHTNFDVSVTSDMGRFSFPDSSFSTYSFFEDNGLSRAELTWYDETGTEFSGNEATPFQLSIDTITDMELVPGEYNPSTQIFDNEPVSDTVRAWFSETSGSKNTPDGYKLTIGAFYALMSEGTVDGDIPGAADAYHAWIAFEYDTSTILPADATLIGNAQHAGVGAWDSGWVLGIDSGTNGLFGYVEDDSGNTDTVLSTAPIIDGKVHVAFIIVDVNTDTMTISLDGVETVSSSIGLAAPVTGSLNLISVAASLGFGAFASGSTIYGFGSGDFVPTTEQIAGVGAYYGASAGSMNDAYDLFFGVGSEEFLTRTMVPFDTANYTDEKGVVVSDIFNTIDSTDFAPTSVSIAVDDTSIWEFGSGSTAIQPAGIFAATPLISDVVFQSLNAGSLNSIDWLSPVQLFDISVNGNPSLITSPKDTTVILSLGQIFTDTVTSVIDSGSEELIIFPQGGNVVFPAGSSVDVNGEPVSVGGGLIFVNGNGFAGSISITATDTLVFSSTYTTDVIVWNSFEATYNTATSGTVDINGPWRHGSPPAIGNVNKVFENIALSRADFGITDSSNFIVRWIGVEVANNSKVTAWIDSNGVLPAVDEGLVGDATTYPTNAIVEVDTGGTFTYEPFPIKVRVTPGPDKQWNPAVHAGYAFDGNKETYLYADEGNEFATPAADAHILGDVARQGAPIIVKSDTGSELRQVAFWDQATPGISLTNIETVNGSGTNKLYLGYDNVYAVSIVDTTTGLSVAGDTTSTSQIIGTTAITDRNHAYEVSYKLSESFIADNDYIYSDGTQRTKLTFDQDPVSAGYSNYEIWYEQSKYNPATPISMPLHPFYTVVDEGFIFLSDNEYDLSDNIEMRFSPSSMVADGNDYIMMSLRTYDINGNPKPNQAFSLTTDFGEFEYNGTTASNVNVTTDNDGFISLPIVSAATTSTNVGTVDITGALTATGIFNIIPTKTPTPTLVASVTSDRIPSDALSHVYVFGRYLDTDKTPLAAENINWRKGRHVYNVFDIARSVDMATPGTSVSGSVTTDSDGKFTIGPFVSQDQATPGYWFVAVEGTYIDSGATPYEGDIVSWQEYPDSIYGVESYSSLPKAPFQHLESLIIPEYATPIFPVYYDESTPTYASPSAGGLVWEPPQWYGIDRYTQYQLGLLGTGYYDYDYTTAQASEHPDYKEL